MKIVFVLFFMYSVLFSKVYYSKLDPYEIRDISSNVSGLVLFTADDLIGKKLSQKPYIKIDAELDEVELKLLEEKLVLLDNTLKDNRKIIENLQESLTRKEENYKKIAALQIKSKVEKDQEFYDLVATRNQLLGTQKEIDNLEVQINDLKLRESVLKRSISDKNLAAKNFVLYSILVKPGQVVAMATPLAQIADTTRGLLTVYLDEEDLPNIESKKIYLDGKKTDYQIERLLNIADGKNISKYKAQIVVKAPKIFSKLVKVEFKDE